MKDERLPCCPRCGYDQSGVVAAWGECCPVRGVCSECGLQLAWVDVMRPDRDRVAGFIEHARGGRAVLRCLASTARLAMWPPVFWARVKMHLQPRAGRAALWVVLVCGFVWAFKAVVGMALVWAESFIPDSDVHYLINQRGVPMWHLLAEGASGRVAQSQFLSFLPAGWWSAYTTWLWSDHWVLAASTIVWPLSFVALPHTRRRAKVRAGHVWRGFCYSWVWLLVLDVPWVLWTICRALDDVLALTSGTPGIADRTGATALAQFASAFVGSGVPFAMSVWLWLALWWFMAIRRGLQLPQATWVWVALGVINALATVVVGTLWWAMRVMA